MDTNVTTEWEQSPDCGALFAALAKAQGDIEAAEKGKENPHFRSRYADLAAVWDACRAQLSKNELSIIQQPFTRGTQTGVRTLLGHSSGQWVACIATTTPRDQGPQAYGSCVTYLRRYALAAFAGVAPDDDDGEAATGRDKDAKPPGANWGKERSAPKANPRAGSASNQNAAGSAKTEARDTSTTDTGEVLDAGQLADLAEAFDSKWGRGAKSAAPSWLKANFGTDNAAALTKKQALEALLMLQGAA